MKTLFFLLFSTFAFGQNNTMESRFLPPSGYKRSVEKPNSFGYFLRNLPLKPVGSAVKYFDGSLKTKANVYDAVVDLPIGNRDLHQCADAVMRLRADYFYQQKAFQNIHFNFTNGFNADYARWRKGERIVVKGNKTTWSKTTKPSESWASYWSYMEMVFSYAGTASLAKELKNNELNNLKIGDVFIKGGFPGHAVIVVDVAIHPKTNKKVFLLAQSYMPAQEIQILKNPSNATLSPWYEVDFTTNLETPEWIFKTNEFKQF
jgi:Domain of unknown function (4846)